MLESRRDGNPKLELQTLVSERGFYRLPKPNKDDLFLDLEGDPSNPDGHIDYLFGIWDGRDKTFHEFWAHEAAGASGKFERTLIDEKTAFEQTIDFICRRIAESPDAYVYHYGHYEIDQLKRISLKYCTRESEVNEILRKRKMVDLLQVAQESIRTSESGYGLKTLEVFFLPGGRKAALKNAQDSVVLYSQWLSGGSDDLINQIRNYNIEDCQSTQKCRDWLISLIPAGVPHFSSDPFNPDKNLGDDSDTNGLRLSLTGVLAQGEENFCELLVQIAGYHEREWNFDWQEWYRRKDNLSTEEYVEASDCLGDLRLDHIEPPVGKSKRNHYVYKFRPGQEYKFSEGDMVVFVDIDSSDIENGDRAGDIANISRDKFLVSVAHPGDIGTKDLPETFSLAPRGPLDIEIFRDAVMKYIDSVKSGNGRYRAITRFLKKELPDISGLSEGDCLIKNADFAFKDLFNIVNCMNESVIFIQGPPGCGKTTVGGELISSLIAEGKKIGVSSNSHKAIHELLSSAERSACRKGDRIAGQKKGTKNSARTHYVSPLDSSRTGITNIFQNALIDVDSNDLIAGTKWLFARSELDNQLDYLFIDEAGQISLADMLTMGMSAKNIVLIGDHMQLSHPSPVAHPGKSGLSCLEYLLEDRFTVDADKGVFLGKTWRMNSGISRFISQAVYDGRLISDDLNDMQVIGHSQDDEVPLPESGIRFFEIDHSQCSQTSVEEAELARHIVDDLLTRTYVDKRGQVNPMTLEDIMVVAPYNAQVNLIKERLPNGARVGTIDLFQGQECQAIVVSMTTSSKDDMPRHMEFLYSRNRLNVALSRARCLSVVLAGFRLFSVRCNTVDQMKLVNVLCWGRTYGSISPENDSDYSSHVVCFACMSPNDTFSAKCGICSNPMN